MASSKSAAKAVTPSRRNYADVAPTSISNSEHPLHPKEKTRSGVSDEYRAIIAILRDAAEQIIDSEIKAVDIVFDVIEKGVAFILRKPARQTPRTNKQSRSQSSNLSNTRARAAKAA
jgi:hypothetical protein